jgi:hypothetical protein
MITVKVTDGEIEEILTIDGTRLIVTVGGIDVVLRNSLGDMTGESLWSTVANGCGK